MLNFFFNLVYKFLLLLTGYKFKNTNFFNLTIIYLSEKFFLIIKNFIPNLIFNKTFNDIISFRSDYHFIQGNYSIAKKIFNGVISKIILEGFNSSDEISLDYRYLTSFGELSAQLDIFIKFNKIYRNSLYNSAKKKNKFICYYKFRDCSNLTFIRIWKDYINFKDLSTIDKSKKIFFLNTRWLPIKKKNIYNFYPYSGIYPEIQKKWVENKNNNLASLTNDLNFRAKKYLKKYYKFNLSNKKFVTVHINNFYKRNFDFHKIRIIKKEHAYIKALKFLKKLGYQIIILSDKKTKILKKDFVNICTNENLPSFISIYLLSKNAFSICGPSGPGMVPYIFGKNSVWLNMIPFQSTPPLKDDFYVFKKCFRNKKIIFKEMFDELYIRHSNDYFHKNKIIIKDNTEEEIYNILKEFLKIGLKKQKIRKKYNLLRYNITKEISYSQISSYFLEKNFKKLI